MVFGDFEGFALVVASMGEPSAIPFGQVNHFLSVETIKKIREAGIRVLMDDFGIGYSNLGNLRAIPFDAVKIDKSLCRPIAYDERSHEIVKLLIGFCKASGMEVVAEGIDDVKQVEMLRADGCDTIQGFYFARAYPLEEYSRLLLDNTIERKGGRK